MSTMILRNALEDSLLFQYSMCQAHNDACHEAEARVITSERSQFPAKDRASVNTETVLLQVRLVEMVHGLSCGHDGVA